MRIALSFLLVMGTLGCDPRDRFKKPPPQPVPDDIPGECEGIVLETPVNGSSWGLAQRSIVIRAGETKTFCLRVEAPFVPDDEVIDVVWASFENEPDQVCATVEVELEQGFVPEGSPDGMPAIAYSGGNSGSATLQGVRGRPPFNVIEEPWKVERGWYIFRVTSDFQTFPDDDFCATWVIRWGWG